MAGVSKVGGRESGDREEERLEWRDGAVEASECRARFHDLNPYLISSWSSSEEVSVPFPIIHIAEEDIGSSIKRWMESREEQVEEAA